LGGARPWTSLAGALSVSVRATPKGGPDSIDGIGTLDDGTCILKIRVRAAPADGAANDALARVLAKAVGVPPSRVTLLQGAAGRRKVFRIEGDPATLAAALDKAAGKRSDGT
jgi:uncharacterized protein